MTTYNWGTLRTQLTQTWKEGPSAAIEQRILEIFKDAPALVDAAAKDVTNGHKQGRIRNPWPFLATQIERMAAGNDVTVDDTTEREKKISTAETWIRNAGIYIEQPDELEHELFDAAGARLRLYATDETLRKRMVKKWEALRPIGEKAEHDSADYMEKLRADRAKLAERKTT